MTTHPRRATGTGMMSGQTHIMNDDEAFLAKQFGLRPDEARVLSALREAEGYCPDECIHHDSNTRKVLICKLRKKTQIKIVNIRGIGYRLEAA